MTAPAADISFNTITKTFAGVVALNDVSLSITRGECHGLMGENGAGKSTLGKVLAGIYRPDGGTMSIDGRPYSPHSPRDATRAGVGMVHQELAFAPDLSVAENLVMGQYPRRLGLFIDRGEMSRRAERLLGEIGVTSLDVSQPMRALSTAQEQLVQIASAVGTGAGILVFDEPTSSLSETEAQALFTLIERLRARGVTIIYVSHRMPEVFRLCDRISVLRDGRYVGTLTRDEATQERVVHMMIGRHVEEFFPKHLDGGSATGATSASREPLLEVRDLSSPGKFQDVSFDLRPGEIVGFAGLVGAGRSEVARAIFGLDKRATGSVRVAGEPLRLGSVRAAMRAGLGLVPEDRKRQGLVLMMGSRENFSLAMLERFERLGFITGRAERDRAAEYVERLRVKTPDLETPVAALSGGNQQKVALAKWLGRGAKVLIVDEPTRGVDIGAKAAIHALLDDLARQGVGLILISSELPEVLNLSTRILVMREGQLIAEVPRVQATQEHVLRLMAGVGELETASVRS
jgi:ABC-type sugar transport system ATPase subunit